MTHHSAVHQSFSHKLAEKAELGLNLVDMRHFSIACQRRREQTSCTEHVSVSVVAQFVALHRLTAPQLQIYVLHLARHQSVELQSRTKPCTNLCITNSDSVKELKVQL